MLLLLILLLFGGRTNACECPGISIAATGQNYCWQILGVTNSWAAADAVCKSIDARLAHPDSLTELAALKNYLASRYTKPVLTGYSVGNNDTGSVSIVCRDNTFYSVSPSDSELFTGAPTADDGCVFITNADYKLHYMPCSTDAVALCIQPEEEEDYCSVAPTCATSTTDDSTTSKHDFSTASTPFSSSTGNTTSTTTFSTIKTKGDSDNSTYSTSSSIGNSTRPSNASTGTVSTTPNDLFIFNGTDAPDDTDMANATSTSTLKTVSISSSVAHTGNTSLYSSIASTMAVPLLTTASNGTDNAGSSSIVVTTTTVTSGVPPTGTTTQSSSTECRSGGVMFFGWCVPLWLLILLGILALALLLCCLLACCHYLCGWLFCCKSHNILKPKDAAIAEEERVVRIEKAVQCDPIPKEKEELLLPPNIAAPAAVVMPAVIPTDTPAYMEEKEEIVKPETEDKGMMTEPIEPIIVYVEKEVFREIPIYEERDILPPVPIMPQSSIPHLVDEDTMSLDSVAIIIEPDVEELPPQNKGSKRQLVDVPDAIIVTGMPRARKPLTDIPHRNDSRPVFPAMPRRPLYDDEDQRPQVKPKRTKQKREPIEPLQFRHNSRPGRPHSVATSLPEEIEEPKTREPRSFPPPPPSAEPQPRSFPQQFARPIIPQSTPEPRRIQKRVRSASPSREAEAPRPPYIAPKKMSKPLMNDYRSDTELPPILADIPSFPDEKPPKASRNLDSPINLPKIDNPRTVSSKPKSVAGSKQPSRARSLSPDRKTPINKPLLSRNKSPLAKENEAKPAASGSLFKGTPSNGGSGLRAARGKLGGIAGGYGDKPEGWKPWTSSSSSFSATPSNF